MNRLLLLPLLAASLLLAAPLAAPTTVLSTASYQTLFDQAQISSSAVPEPATTAAVRGVGALALAGWRRPTRLRRAAAAHVPQKVR